MRTDYILHFAVSALLCISLAQFLRLPIASAITLAVGISKELIWDKALKKGTPEWKDLLADLAGIAYACIVMSI